MSSDVGHNENIKMEDTQTEKKSGILEAVDDPRVLDPLSEVTRRERKTLLLASLLAFAISIGGLVPTEIEALGIKLSQTERDSILLLVSFSIIYLLSGFFIYSLADIRSRNIAIALGRRKISPELSKEISKAQSRVKEYIDNKKFDMLHKDPVTKKYFAASEDLKIAGKAKATGMLRVAFDFYLPIIVGLVAVSFSLYEARGLLIARITAVVITFLVLLMTVIQSFRRRKQVKNKIKNVRNRWYKWRTDKLLKRIKKLEKDDPKQKDLQKKIKYLFNKNIQALTK